MSEKDPSNKETVTPAIEKKEGDDATPKTNEELAEHKETILPVAESMQINAELLSTIKTELEGKIGAEKTEIVLTKIAELTPSTIAANIRGWAKNLENAADFLGRFGIKVPSKEITGAAQEVAGVAEEINNVGNEVTNFQKELSGLTKGIFGSEEKESISGDRKIDKAFGVFEKKMEEIKGQKGIDTAGHYAGVTVALSAFLSVLKQPDAAISTALEGSAVGTAAAVVEKLEDENLGDDNDYTEELLSEKLETNHYPVGMPIKGFTEGMVTSKMGIRKSPVNGASTNHKGIDIGVPVGTEILAPADGKVIGVKAQMENGNLTGGGYYIDIDHGSFITRYMHLSKQSVKEGQIVKKGEEIAKSGDTGNSSGPHLHYEIRYKGEVVDETKKNARKYLAVDPLHFIDLEGDGQVLAMNNYKLLKDANKLVA